MSENVSRFNGCKLTNVKLNLNSECYRYDDMNLDCDKNRWSILYDMYTHVSAKAITDMNISSQVSLS